MAVMLRVAHIPARVAIGFTPGIQKNGYQSISSQDAHAWVEAYFGDKGWVSFDPTPLADGRGIVPPYLERGAQNSNQPSAGKDVPTAPRSVAPPSSAPADKSQDQAAPATPTDTEPNDAWLVWLAVVLAVLGAAAVVASYVLRRRPPPAADLPPAGVPPGARPDGALLVAAPAPARTPLGRAALWLPLAGAALLVAAVAFLAGLVSWWFGVLVALVLVAVGAPAAARDLTRRLHLQTIAVHTPGAADAAWRELKAECADRDLPLSDRDTIRVAGGKIAAHHHLDEPGREALRTVLGAVERSWYSETGATDPTLEPAFRQLRESLRRTAPLSWRGRLFPRSVLRRRR
jgi:hypothetical protein